VVAVAGLAAEETGGMAAGTGGTAGGGGAGGGSDALWSGSLTGPQTVLTAPAVNLIGARPGGYWKVQGTSFAAPQVAATATLIRSRWPGMDAPNVINRLIRTAKDLGVTGRDDRYGYGEVNPVPALTAEVVTVRRNPLDRHAAEADKAIEGLRGRLPARSAPAVRATAREPVRIDAVLTPVRVALSVTTGVAVFLLLLLAGVAFVRRRL
jgi:hypothetical protein